MMLKNVMCAIDEHVEGSLLQVRFSDRPRVKLAIMGMARRPSLPGDEKMTRCCEASMPENPIAIVLVTMRHKHMRPVFNSLL